MTLYLPHCELSSTATTVNLKSHPDDIGEPDSDIKNERHWNQPNMRLSDVGLYSE